MPNFILTEKEISTGLLQFIFPLSYDSNKQESLNTILQSHGFTFYDLTDVQNETAYFGQYRVAQQDLNSFFHPMAVKFLFPKSRLSKGFQRFSRNLNSSAQLSTKHFTLSFQVHSADLILCPFELGFLTIRTEFGKVSLSHAIEFANCFSTPEPNKELSIFHEGNAYAKSTDFLNALFPGFQKVLPAFPLSGQIFVQSLLSFEKDQTIDMVNLFRVGTLSGVNEAGEPYTAANNKEYIDAFIRKHCYHRWAPQTCYVIDEACFSGITTQQLPGNGKLAGQFYGPFYYSMLIHLFHRLMFLQIADEYASLNLDQDQNKIKHLVYKINSFMSNFYYAVHPANSSAREIFTLVKKHLSIEELYQKTNDILFSLIKYEEHAATKKDTLLLLILTLFTVICGIFSINLFTHDLEGNINWSHFKSYNPFEYFAVIIVFSGILTVMFLLIQSLYQSLRDRKIQKRLINETVLSGKKRAD